MKFKIYRRNQNSICETPEQLLAMMSHIRYADFDSLQSPLQTFLSACGSCHDQALFELQELSDMGLVPHAKFIMTVDDEGLGGETHSFVYYKLGNDYCWFENAWKDLRGIRKYTSESELFDAVMFAFGQRVPFDKLYIADFIPEEHTIGEDLDTFVGICMNSAEEYEIS